MNGKVAKMLRKMRRDDNKSKKFFHTLTSKQRAELRSKHDNNPKMVYTDFLRDFQA